MDPWIIGNPYSDEFGCLYGTNDVYSDVFNGSDWTEGPVVPYNVFGFGMCFCELNATHTLETAGPGYTWMYDWRDHMIDVSDGSHEQQHCAGCTVLPDNGDVLVVYDYSDYDYSVHLYDPVENTWTPEYYSLPTRPIEIMDSKLLNTGNDVLILLRGDHKVYQRVKYADQTYQYSFRPIDGVRLPHLFPGRPLDKVIVVPRAFNLGCLQLS